MVTRVERSYGYVGPADLTRLVRPEAVGKAVESFAEFSAWVATRSTAELEELFTFVIDLSGCLRLAARRSEHVVCAGGQRVLGAGEIVFEQSAEGWTVGYVSNQSTGYCPDLSSWDAVADALDRAGLPRPPGFTQQVVFRRCSACAELNVVKEDFFVCSFCDSDLPAEWNVSATASRS
jgi:hypothetical protein